MNKPDGKDLKEIGFKEFRLYSRIYKVWGYKQTLKGAGKNKRITKDKNFLTCTFSRYATKTKLNIIRSTTDQFYLNFPIVVQYPKQNFSIIK